MTLPRRTKFAVDNGRAAPPPSDTLGVLGKWFVAHRMALSVSLYKMLQAPVSSLFTILVIAAPLALCAIFFTLLGNVKSLATIWPSSVQLTLYLAPDVEQSAGQAFARQLKKEPHYLAVEFISSGEGLAQFRQHSGLGDLLDLLDDNPLPATIVLTPKPRYADATTSAQLASALQKYPEVDSVRYDLQWIERLNTLIEFFWKLAWALSAILILGVALILSNSIRLEVNNRREEIIVSQLIGATERYIRRPLLYSGLVHGLCGGLISAALTWAVLYTLDAPAQQLKLLYNSPLSLNAMHAYTLPALVIISGLLGWLSANVSVRHHLKSIRPI